MANIFAAYAQPVRSIADYQAEGDNRALRREQLAGAQRTNALADLTAQQTRQTMADTQRSNELIRGAYGQSDVIKALRATGDRAAIDLADKQETQGLARGKTEAETAKLKTEDSEIKRKALLQQVAALQSPADALALIDHGVQSQSLPEQIAVGLRNMVKTDPRWQLGLMLGIGDPSKMLDILKPHLQTVNAGNAQVQQTVDPRTGAVVETGRTAILQSPDNAASVGATLAGQRSVAETARLGRVQSDRHFNARQGDAAAATAGEDPTQAALNKKFGKPEVGRRWKPDGSLEPIPGGSADRKTNEQQSGKETVDSVAASLRASYDALNAGGGITSTEKGALSNLSAAASRSSAGQVVGGALGTKNQKERDNVAQARPLLLQAIMKATGMSAKQMDSNAELKLYLATATDPTLTLEANRQALDRIESLYGSGSGAAGSASQPGAGKPAGGPAKITDDAGYNALPSGATFVGPDGKTRRKP